MTDAERSDVEARPLAPRPGRGQRRTTPSWCSRAGTRSSRAPDGRVRVTTTGVPWLATAGRRRRPGRRDRVAAGRRTRRRTTRRRSARGCTARPPPWPRGTARSWPATSPGAFPTWSGWWRGRTERPGGNGRIAAMSPSPAPRSWSTWRRSGTTSGCSASWRHRPQMMTVVKADGYGHGLVPAARAAREAGAEWLGVATIDEALDAARRRATTGRVLCWLGVPGEDYAGGDRARTSTSRAYTVAELAEIRAGRPGRPRRPGCSSRSTPGSPAAARPRPGLAGAWSTHARAGEEAGDWTVTGDLVALRVQRRARPPGQRRPGEGLPRRARRRRAGRAAARGAAPGQLGGRDPAPVVPVRPGPLRHRVLRPGPRARRRRPTSAWSRR